MFEKLKKIWIDMSTEGINLPFARDQETKKPSVTLLSYYIMLVLTILSLIALHFKVGLAIATTFTILCWCLSFVFYKLRRLAKAKIDLDDASIELESNSKKKSKSKKEKE